MSSPYVVQWGILGCGWMSSMFVKDLCYSPSTRNTHDVSHAVVAIGSRSLSKAQEFIKTSCPSGAAAQKEGLVKLPVTPHGSYEGVINDPNVDVVYVGTMNISHFDDALLALKAGKHCLLEKPATLNAEEWKILSSLAKENGVFLMEAVWTRFNPNLLAVQESVHSGEIGEIRCLYSDLSMRSLDTKPSSHRLLNPQLAGGCLLDLGPYPLLWALTMLFRHPKNGRLPPSRVGSTMLMHNGVDIATTFSLVFSELNAIANCTVNLLSATDESASTRIVGSKGEIIVHGITSCPKGYTVKRYRNPKEEALHDDAAESIYLPNEHHAEEFGGVGWHFEADAVARCLRDGQLECDLMPHEETLMTMSMFDQIRKEGGYHFLPGLEKVSA